MVMWGSRKPFRIQHVCLVAYGPTETVLIQSPQQHMVEKKKAPEVKLKVEAGPRPRRTPCLLPGSRTGVGVCVTVSLIMKILYLVWDTGA